MSSSVLNRSLDSTVTGVISRLYAQSCMGIGAESRVVAGATTTEAEPELKELIERARLGEREAAGVLFDRYQPMVAKVLVRILGPDPELADVIQDSFVRAFKGIKGLQHRAGFVAWLRRIAATTAMDHLRKRRSRRWLIHSEELPQVEVDDDRSDLREALRRTYAILDGLPVVERTAFALRFLSGLELTEVADATSSSLATVKRRLKRARSAFMEQAERDPVLQRWRFGGVVDSR